MEQKQNKYGTCPRCHGTNRMAAAGELRTCASCVSEAWKTFMAAEETQYLPLRATPPAPEAPTAAAEAGELPLLTEVLKLRGMVSSKEELLRVSEAKLANATKVAEDAFQEAARLQQELAEARAGGWVPVGERLPETKPNNHPVFPMRLSDTVLIAEKGQTADTLGYCNKQGEWFKMGGGGYAVSGITHWQPLPPAPAQTPLPATPEAREAGGEEGGREV